MKQEDERNEVSQVVAGCPWGELTGYGKAVVDLIIRRRNAEGCRTCGAVHPADEICTFCGTPSPQAIADLEAERHYCEREWQTGMCFCPQNEGDPMSSGNTPLRSVRIPDEIWKPAKEIAASRGETLSEVIRKALAEYITKN